MPGTVPQSLQPRHPLPEVTSCHRSPQYPQDGLGFREEAAQTNGQKTKPALALLELSLITMAYPEEELLRILEFIG